MLNRGGSANPDVLLVRSADCGQVVVKDYGRRSRPVRRWLAPLLVRHELAMLERLEGLPGVPRPLGKVGSAALALEYVQGRPLRRRSHFSGLPLAFFAALEGILAGLAARRVLHLDLRSPTNVLCTESGAPALVDLSSALHLPLPARLLEWLGRRALAKLRGRFLASPADPAPELSAVANVYVHIQVGWPRVRLRYRDEGFAEDPVPALLLPDAGHTAAQFAALLSSAARYGRRAIAVELPGFGGSAPRRRPLRLGAAAAAVRAFLDALRLERIDLVGELWGGLVARELAAGEPARVRSIATLDTPAGALVGRLRERWELAHSRPAALRERLLADLPLDLEAEERMQAEWLLRRGSSRAGASAYRRLRVQRAAPPCSAPALRDVPFPAQPWLFAVSSGADEARAELADRAPLARVVEQPDLLGSRELLWKELAG